MLAPIAIVHGVATVQNTSFLQSQTILHALEFALSKGAFGNNANRKKAAQSLIQQLKSNRSVGGRQQQLLALLKRGATIEQMMKATTASRRTIFRYLNYFEEAGMDLVLTDSVYKLK